MLWGRLGQGVDMFMMSTYRFRPTKMQESQAVMYPYEPYR